MKQRLPLVVILLFTMLIISACSKNDEAENEEYPYGHYKDDKMIGTVLEIDQSEDIIIVDISEWEKRDKKGPIMTGDGYSYTAKITNETIIKYEDGAEASLNDIKRGQKILVNPPRENEFEGPPKELVLLKMTYEEKYSRFLAHIDGFNIIIMYETGQELPTEMEEAMYENAMEILDEIGEDAVGAWIEYDEYFIVDYKKELDIEQLPAILVFNKEEPVFKGYNADELYDFLGNLNK